MMWFCDEHYCSHIIMHAQDDAVREALQSLPCDPYESYTLTIDHAHSVLPYTLRHYRASGTVDFINAFENSCEFIDWVFTSHNL